MQSKPVGLIRRLWNDYGIGSKARRLEAEAQRRREDEFVRDSQARADEIRREKSRDIAYLQRIGARGFRASHRGERIDAMMRRLAPGCTFIQVMILLAALGIAGGILINACQRGSPSPTPTPKPQSWVSVREAEDRAASAACLSKGGMVIRSGWHGGIIDCKKIAP